MVPPPSSTSSCPSLISASQPVAAGATELKLRPSGTVPQSRWPFLRRHPSGCFVSVPLSPRLQMSEPPATLLLCLPRSRSGQVMPRQPLEWGLSCRGTLFLLPVSPHAFDSHFLSRLRHKNLAFLPPIFLFSSPSSLHPSVMVLRQDLGLIWGSISPLQKCWRVIRLPQ